MWSLIFGVVVSLTFTPLIIRLAKHIGLLDLPDGKNKQHPCPTPLGGGLAVIGAVILALYLTTWSVPGSSDLLAQIAIVPCVAATLLIFIIGLADDVWHLNSCCKLVCQCLVVTAFVAATDPPSSLNLLGRDLALGWLALPFGVFWLLGAVNSMNLLDGLDGVASLISILASVTIAVLAMLSNQPAVALLAMAVCGALIGFAVFNRPPARIFLGDAGSTAIGFILGYLTLRVLAADTGSFHLVPAIAIWSIPIFDTSIAILRRVRAGSGIFCGDRLHLQHRLYQRFGGHWTVLGVLLICVAGNCLSATLGFGLASDFVSLAFPIGCILWLVASGTFGESELSFRIPRPKIPQELASQSLGDLSFESETPDNPLPAVSSCQSDAEPCEALCVIDARIDLEEPENKVFAIMRDCKPLRPQSPQRDCQDRAKEEVVQW